MARGIDRGSLSEGRGSRRGASSISINEPISHAPPVLPPATTNDHPPAPIAPNVPPHPNMNGKVGKKVVNIPSFLARMESAKHIDFALISPFGGGREGRVKRKNKKVASKKEEGDEEDED